jgi:ABC-type oligopeptide transport system ATPase subunit
MTNGTLRDQLIYPHTATDMAAHNFTDANLLQLLDSVYLPYLAERPKGLDAVEEWADVLSGGEKQRIAMARLFYHNPEFAILDECTAAVSLDVEKELYARCQQKNITLLTISHRHTLWKYHQYQLRFEEVQQSEGKTSRIAKFEKLDSSTIPKELSSAVNDINKHIPAHIDSITSSTSHTHSNVTNTSSSTTHTNSNLHSNINTNTNSKLQDHLSSKSTPQRPIKSVIKK